MGLGMENNKMTSLKRKPGQIKETIIRRKSRVLPEVLEMEITSRSRYWRSRLVTRVTRVDLVLHHNMIHPKQYLVWPSLAFNTASTLLGILSIKF